MKAFEAIVKIVRQLLVDNHKQHYQCDNVEIVAFEFDQNKGWCVCYNTFFKGKYTTIEQWTSLEDFEPISLVEMKVQ
jgi:hypothetical protein